MSRKAKREEFEDDGRTIANMNVDGMPWYARGVRDPLRDDPDSPASDGEKPRMSRGERRGYIRAALAATLLIAGVFAVAYGLFLLFCTFVWFK